MIADSLLPLARPISDLKLLEGNPRRGDVQAVKRSLARFGQRKPIVVRADGTVEAGNTTLRDDGAGAARDGMGDQHRYRFPSSPSRPALQTTRP